MSKKGKQEAAPQIVAMPQEAGSVHQKADKPKSLEERVSRLYDKFDGFAGSSVRSFFTTSAFLNSFPVLMVNPLLGAFYVPLATGFSYVLSNVGYKFVKFFVDIPYKVIFKPKETLKYFYDNYISQLVKSPLKTIGKMLTAPIRAIGSLTDPGRTSKKGKIFGSLIGGAFFLNTVFPGYIESTIDSIKDFLGPSVTTKIGTAIESTKYGFDSLCNKIYMADPIGTVKESISNLYWQNIYTI